jgi:hypothetical protein
MEKCCIQYLGNIEWLDLSYCNHLTNGLHFLRGVKKLNLNDTSITDDDLGALYGQGGPKWLFIANCENITGRGLAHLKDKVETINLARISSLTNEDIKTMSSANVKTIIIARNQNITDDIFSYFPNVEYIDLARCTKINGTGLHHLFQRPRSLDYLRLEFSNLFNQALIELSQCPNFQGIKRLYIRACLYVQSVGLKALYSQYIGQELDVAGFYVQDDDYLAELKKIMKVMIH